MALEIMDGIWIDGLFKAGNLDQKDTEKYMQIAQFIEGRQVQLHIEKKESLLILGSCFFFERNRKSHAVYLQIIPLKEKQTNIISLVLHFFISAEQSIKDFFKNDSHIFEIEKFGIGEKHESCRKMTEILHEASKMSSEQLGQTLGIDKILLNVVYGKFLLNERVIVASTNYKRSIVLIAYLGEKFFHETSFNFKLISSERDLYEADTSDLSVRQAPSKYDINLDTCECKSDDFTQSFYSNAVSVYQSLRSSGKLKSMNKQDSAAFLNIQISSRSNYKNFPLETLVNSVAGRRIALEQITLVEEGMHGTSENDFLKLYEKMSEPEKKLLFLNFLEKNNFQKNVFDDIIKSIFQQKDNDLANIIIAKKFPEYQQYKRELKGSLLKLDWKDSRIIKRAQDLLMKILSSPQTEINEGGRLFGFYLFSFLKQERSLDKNIMKEYCYRLHYIDVFDYQEKSLSDRVFFIGLLTAFTGWIAFVIGILYVKLGYIDLLESINRGILSKVTGLDQGPLFIIEIVSITILLFIVIWFFGLRERFKK